MIAMGRENTTDWPAVTLGFVTALGLCSGVALIFLFLFFGSWGLWSLDVGYSGFELLASVFSGFLVVLVSLTSFVPVVAGLCGGAIASSQSASGLRSGCWHGLLAGAMSGVSVAIGFVVLQQMIQQIFFPGPLLRSGWSMLPAMGVLFLLTTIPSVIAGGAGGRYRIATGERTPWW